jgi:protein-tyrosine phosphatase
MLSMRRTIGLLRTLEPHEKWVHLKLAVLRAIGVRRDELPRNAAEIRKVLFVCHGNIIRSPMAEAWMTKLLADSEVTPRIESSSAGVFASKQREMDVRAFTISAEMGVSLAGHSARQLTREDVRQADLICVMDAFNETVCVARYPDSEPKTVLLGAFGRASGESLEILDPIQGSMATVRACYERVARSVQALVDELAVNRRQQS